MASGDSLFCVAAFPCPAQVGCVDESRVYTGDTYKHKKLFKRNGTIDVSKHAQDLQINGTNYKIQSKYERKAGDTTHQGRP